MLNPSEWGDEVVLNIAAYILQVDIIIIPAFKESGINQGVTIIKCLQETRHHPLFLFCFSESDFSPAHYVSVFPKSESNDLLTRFSCPRSVPPFIPAVLPTVLPASVL